MKKILLVLLCFSFCFANISAFIPSLTSRVVDNANLLSEDNKFFLEKKLQQLDTNTAHELVILTLKSLHGYSIEEFSLETARAWKIGKNQKDNGVLFLIAPNERKVRIEVGYGLEGSLTDYISSRIIQEIIIPELKNNNFQRGILKGADEIIRVLQEEQLTLKSKNENDNFSKIFQFSFILFVISSFLMKRFEKQKNLFGFKIFKSLLLGGFFAILTSLVANSFGLSSFMIIFIFILVFIIIFIISFISTKNFNLNSNKNSAFTNYNNFKTSFNNYKGGGGSFGGGGASGSW